MPLFGKRKQASHPASAPAPAPAFQETRLDRAAIAAVISHIEGERDAANARAAAEFGLDALQSWTLDLDLRRGRLHDALRQVGGINRRARKPQPGR